MAGRSSSSELLIPGDGVALLGCQSGPFCNLHMFCFISCLFSRYSNTFVSKLVFPISGTEPCTCISKSMVHGWGIFFFFFPYFFKYFYFGVFVVWDNHCEPTCCCLLCAIRFLWVSHASVL